jgi:hypothetical protein
MKDYSRWMNEGSSAEEVVYDLSAKSQIKINNDEATLYESIINDANEWQKEVDLIWLIKKSLFTPKHGDYITFNGKKYLSVFVPEERDFFWSSKMRLCNSNFPLPGTTTRTKIGNDPRTGRPVYEDVTSPPTLLPCIVESTIYLPNDSQTIQLPNGKILVTLPYTVNDVIAENKEFEMYGEQYKIVGIDRSQSVDGVGLMILHCERVI